MGGCLAPLALLTAGPALPLQAWRNDPVAARGEVRPPLDLHLPAATTARLTLRTDVPSLRIDSMQRSQASVPQVIEEGDVSVPDRYEVEVAAGVSTLTVEHL